MRSVVICGSNKFAKEALAFAESLQKAGVVVFTPHFYTATVGDIADVREADRKFVAMGLTHDHFHKIRLADAVFIFNKSGYVGNSVTMEIGYAIALNKPIYALSDKDPELCRTILFSGICKTPKALAKKLQ